MSRLHRSSSVTKAPCINCPCCDATDTVATYSYGNSLIYCCQSCDFEFLRPLPLTEVSQRQMDSIADAELFSPMLRALHERLIVWPEIRKVRKLLGRNNFKMLDIGCGTGWISKIWTDSGACVTGLEPSQTRGEIARKRGIRVLPCYVEDIDSSEYFDLIVIRHVLEHLENPRDILKSLHSRLNPGGLVLIVVPNIDCIGRKLFDTDWTWVLPWHCNFFNPESLRTLLHAANYETTMTYQTPSPLWYSESFVRRFPTAGKLLQFSFLSMLLFSPLVAIGILTGLSDNLTAIARSRCR